jgi:hypothetical protein
MTPLRIYTVQMALKFMLFVDLVAEALDVQCRD